MISFKGKHYPKDVILFTAFFYLRYPVFHYDLEEIMEGGSVDVDHATLNRRVIEYAPLVAEGAQKRKAQTSRSWRIEETYVSPLHNRQLYDSMREIFEHRGRYAV